MIKISKYTYQRRKEQGLCVLCGNEKDSEYVTCLSCRNKQKQDSKDRRDFLKNIGICYKCGKNKLFAKEKICPECLAKCNQAKKYSYNADNYKEKYNELKEQKICTRCKKRNSVENKVYCKQCLIKHRDNARIYRIEKNGYIQRNERYSYGLCYICGDELQENKKLCNKCNNKVINNLPDSPSDEYRKFIYKGFKFNKTR